MCVFCQKKSHEVAVKIRLERTDKCTVQCKMSTEHVYCPHDGNQADKPVPVVWCNLSVVKTPTKQQYNPTSTSTTLVFDTKMAMQTPPPTPYNLMKIKQLQNLQTTITIST